MGSRSEMLRCPMLFLWFDHPLIEAWLEREARRLRPRLTREDAAPPDDGVLEGLQRQISRVNPSSVARSISSIRPHHTSTPIRGAGDLGALGNGWSGSGGESKGTRRCTRMRQNSPSPAASSSTTPAGLPAD